MKDYSEMFNKYYDIEDTVRIVNTKQAGMYIKYGLKLVDLFWSKDSLVFVFNKEESKPYYDKWCKRELV